MSVQPPSAFSALEKVRAAGGGLYGSAGELFARLVLNTGFGVERDQAARAEVLP